MNAQMHKSELWTTISNDDNNSNSKKEELTNDLQVPSFLASVQASLKSVRKRSFLLPFGTLFITEPYLQFRPRINNSRKRGFINTCYANTLPAEIFSSQKNYYKILSSTDQGGENLNPTTTTYINSQPFPNFLNSSSLNQGWPEKKPEQTQFHKKAN